MQIGPDREERLREEDVSAVRQRAVTEARAIALELGDDPGLDERLGCDGNIAIVATGTGQTITTLVGHSNRIVDLAYSPGGKLIVTGSLDGTARVWDPESGRLLRALDHPAPVFGVAFSPDGRTIATLDADGIVRLWDACSDCENPDALMALAKTRVTRQLAAIEKRTYLG